MTQRIDIQDSTAERLARLQALTGQDIDTVLDAALAARLEQLEMEALRAAVKLGADEADAGLFSTRTVEEIFAEGIARARRRNNG
ncbi:hypothetical protein [Nitrospirillum viridazoti]|uniref:Type II toxin-antitoxin system ParD family antitoxin n=1 Tax=Nitrospirillum viridazoti CBAmc TaxID=1441467 RepID=A0A248JLV8_9PROT|nr:hypothetical protein [Nitrospirillum amazonense]ASG19521.1 hypothetical protein Y958_00800 [Nitrospirillum amazonense CBAmc]TWB26496.1 hypothetical protein FBZ91_14121 [Nitrospirillum amazonense]